MKLITRILFYISIVLLLFTSLLALGSTFSIPGGFRIYSVLTGSMQPAIPIGSLIVTRIPSAVSDIKQNGIITFVEPGFDSKFITHRIDKIITSDSVTLFQTKGDANESPDSWNIAYGSITGNYVLGIPHLGYLLNFIKSPLGIAIFVFLPVAAIAVTEVRTIFTILFQMKLLKDSHLEHDTVKKNIFVFLSFVLSMTLIAWNSQSALAVFISSPVLIQGSIVTTATITPTPTPSDNSDECPSFPDIVIEGNGAGFQNEVEMDINCKTEVSQSNTAVIENNVSVQTNGGNSQSTVNITNTVTTSTQN